MTYRHRDSQTIQAEIEKLESMLASLQSELEAAEEREAMEQRGVPGLLEVMARRKAVIMARVAMIDEEIASLRKR